MESRVQARNTHMYVRSAHVPVKKRTWLQSEAHGDQQEHKCTYISRRARIEADAHAQKHTCTDRNTRSRIEADVHAQKQTCANRSIHARTEAHMNAQKHTCTHSSTHAVMHAQKHYSKALCKSAVRRGIKDMIEDWKESFANCFPPDAGRNTQSSKVNVDKSFLLLLISRW